MNYDNFTVANIIDKLLYEINEKVINLNECSMNMIGIGFGGFFLQTFCKKQKNLLFLFLIFC